MIAGLTGNSFVAIAPLSILAQPVIDSMVAGVSP